MDYPYRIQFGRQVTEIKSDVEGGYYTIKLPLEIPGKPFVMASCNWNMYNTWLTQQEYYMNVKIYNTFPIDDSDQKYRNSFRFKLMPYKWWPQGGIQFISIHKNPSSTIDMIDMPYLIDYGTISYKNISTDPIYFSTAFHSAPTVIMPQIGDEVRFGSVAKIVEVTPLYFRLERTEFNVRDPPPFIEWLAILENPGSKITKEDLPFLLDFGVNPFGDKPSYPLMLNGQTADVSNLIPLKTKFTIPPTIINGPVYNPITQISTEYFMYTTHYYECSWLAVQTKNQDPFINFMTPRIKIKPSDCAKTEYILPEECGSHIYDYPPTCPTHIVPYIPTLTFDYLPRKDFIPPDPARLLSVGITPYLVDVVTLTMTVHVDIKKELWNEIITFSIGSDRTGYITVGTIQPVVKKVEWSFPIFVDISGAIYSKCASMGNVMFCIDTGNVDLIRFKLIFNFSSFPNLMPNFQYYVQLNKDDNLIFGPFKDTATPSIVIGAGAGKCGAFNLKCMVDRYMKIHCKDIVGPAAQYSKQALSKDLKQFCKNVTEGIGTGCYIGMGGPENPLSTIICVPITYTAQKVCNDFITKTMNPKDATDAICGVFET
jgi:hypothetical protein